MFKSEKELLIYTRKIKLELDAVTARKAQLENEYKALKYIVSTYLVDIDAKRTAMYEDIGSVSLLAPLVRAEYEKNQEEAVFDFVREAGEPEIIKLSIHPQSFYGFVGRCIDKGLEIPKAIEYHFEPVIRCNFIKETPESKPANTEA